MLQHEISLRTSEQPGFWFGAKQLPQDQSLVSQMIEQALESGVCTFEAESSVLCALQSHPRTDYALFLSCDIYELADGNVGLWLEQKLAELGLESIDYFMLTYLNEAAATPMAQVEQQLTALNEKKQQGKLRYLGIHFSGSYRALRTFMERYSDVIDFCCLQFNYMDWYLQRAREKCATLKAYGIPLIAVEPSRGGILETLPKELEDEIKGLRSEDSPIDWCINWIKAQGVAALIVNASENNLSAYLNAHKTGKPLTSNEEALLCYVAGELRYIDQALPCSDCSHCNGVCPIGLEIPFYIALLTDLKFQRDKKLIRQYKSLPPHLRASACVACCECLNSCPKGIFIPAIMEELEELTATEGE